MVANIRSARWRQANRESFEESFRSLWCAGNSTTSLADIYDVAPVTIRRWARNQDLPRRDEKGKLLHPEGTRRKEKRKARQIQRDTGVNYVRALREVRARADSGEVCYRCGREFLDCFGHI